MKKTIISVAAGLGVSFLIAGSALAAPNPSGTGQPNANCANETNAPKGFSTGGFANAETHYAGSDNTPSANNANSSHAVSQYDVACYQVSQSH